MSLIDNIKMLAKQHGLSLLQLYDQAHLGKNAIYKWKKQRPSVENLEKVASVLHCSVDDLINDPTDKVNKTINNFHEAQYTVHENTKDALSKILHSYPIGESPLQPANDQEFKKHTQAKPHNYQVRVPILGNIACGEPIFAEQNVVGYRDLTFDHVPSNKLFMLYCQGNSMQPLIPDGSLVTLVRQPTVENGDLAAVLIDDEATIKRVKFAGNEVILIPENNAYDPIVLNKDKPGKILGKVVHVEYDVK